MTGTATHENRLAQETSPYLLQHAHNPVDWYPWGPEALDRAKKEDKPILLSIGYAACHWCHVMERESFENEATAKLMNEHFVCIKVDREERPDLDDVYMTATVAMTGHGGWPMTVFLTPEQEPFFAGTYFPPKDAHGRPGFPTLLSRIGELWRTQRTELTKQAKELVEHVRGRAETIAGAAVGEEAIQAAAAELLESFDGEHGGFGGAPKFPPSASLALLLRLHRRIPDATLLEMTTRTLDAMKNGGIYDHVGGGFARYSTDERWLVPHFEKMLYDNAQLARVYLEAYQVTKNAEYRRVATETLDYVVREMQGVDGGYFSATDADSEGVEGKFFVWSQDQIIEILGQPAAEQFCHHYDVTGDGNWEGTNVLNTPRALEDTAKDLGLSADVLGRALVEARQKLYEARKKRVPPLLDDKVLAAWNGLMISAMAEGARVLRSPKYLDSATRAANYTLSKLRRPDGGLFRTARGEKAHLDAYLEDYAFLSDGLVDLYEAGGDVRFLNEARALGERIAKDFGDAESGAFFQTAHGHETLIARGREGHDGAIPSGNAVAARALSRIGYHLGDTALRDRALAALSAHGRAMERSPRAFATALGVVDLLLEGPIELAIVGEPGRADTEAILAAVAEVYLPNRVISQGNGGPSELPLLAGKTPVSGHAALYVCRDFTCQSPVTNPAQVKVALGQAEAALSESRGRVVGVKRLPGSATAEGTRAYAERFAKVVGEGAFVTMPGTDLRVSRFGFGTYRVDDRVETHREALSHALTEGVNLVDTSTNYGDGHSEKLVGEVLAELEKAGKVGRASVVVVSKIGYAQGENLELLEEREEAGKPFPEVVKYAEGLSHCIHPEWLEDQLGRSLDRLGLETLDVCLLHNPEYFLSHAAKNRVPLTEARTEYYRRITEAFRHLELEVSRGRIRYYGVSSNSLGEPADAVETTDLSRLLEAAKSVAGDSHHFRVAQLPLNLFESGPALEGNTGAAQETALAFAEKSRIGVLVNRPLNAILGDRLVRLADPPELPEAPRVGDQIEKVRALEQDFLKAFGPVLKPPPGSKMQLSDLFRWADQLGELAAHIESYEQFRNVETGQIAPRVMQSLQAVGSVVQGPMAQKFHAFQERYVTELEALLAGLRRRAADRSKARSIAIGKGIEAGLPEGIRSARLSQRALAVLSSLPGVTTVLVGMREPDYVHDVVPAMGGQPIPDAGKVLSLAKTIEVR